MARHGRESALQGRFLDHASQQAAITELARAQHGVLALHQLTGVGLSPQAVQKRAAITHLHRIHRGVYAIVPRELLTGDGRWIAATLACGPGAVLSHRSAAALHQLRSSDQVKIDVTVPVRSARAHPGIRVHRSVTLTAADTTTLRGIPTTTVARTLVDLGRVVDRRGVERALDQADAERVLDLRALTDVLERTPNHRGGPVLREILDEYYIGRTPTWSELEDRFSTICRRLGVPIPKANHFIILPDCEPPIRGDFVWEDRRLVVETDGHKTHRTRQAFERDRRNDQRLIMHGWRVVRITWRQLVYRPVDVEAMLVALMER